MSHRLGLRIRYFVVAALGVLALGLPSVAAAASSVQFADWTAVSDNVATGTLLGQTVTFSGTAVDDPPSSTIDGTSNLLSESKFTPPIPLGDHLSFRVFAPSTSYTLDFGAPTTDPVIDLGSDGSTLTFPAGTSIARISGDSGLTVAGNVVSGAGNTTVDPVGLNDSNGTIQLNGTFQSISFSATTAYPLDGVYLQVGASAPPPPSTTTTTTTTPPPPAPPPPAPANLTPPRLSTDAHTDAGWRYRCSPGSWGGLGPNPTFSYTWYRVPVAPGFSRNGFLNLGPVKVGTGPTYTLPAVQTGGRFFCQVSVADPSGGTLTADSPIAVLGGRLEIGSILNPSIYGNVTVRGIDVFQEVQPLPSAQMFGFNPTTAFPYPTLCGGGTPTDWYGTPCQTAASDAQDVTYQGVRLDERKPTAAMVYVSMDGTPAADASQHLDVTLTGVVDGHDLSGQITKTIANPPVASTPYVTAEERSDASKSVQFDVPPAWLATADLSGSPLALRADVSFPDGSAVVPPRECPLLVIAAGAPNCAADDTFLLHNIGVSDDFPDLTIRTLPLLASGQTSLTPPAQMLSRALQLFPGTEHWTILPYAPSISIAGAASVTLKAAVCKPYTVAPVDPTKALSATQQLRACRRGQVDALVQQWLQNDTRDGQSYNILMATHDYDLGNGTLEPGWTDGGIAPGAVAVTILNDGSAKRPITAAAHEFGHVLGLMHSDTSCGEDATGVQQGEVWLPDLKGRLQGIGADRAPGILLRGAHRYSFRNDALGTFYDLMSYCVSTAAGDPDAWISPRNWNHTFADLTTFNDEGKQRAPLAVAAAAPSDGYVIGVLTPGGGSIEHVVTQAGRAPVPDASSPVVVRSLDASGRLISQAGAAVQDSDDAPGATTFTAPVAPDAASVVLVRDGVVLDTKRRSQPPTLKLRALPRHLRIGRRGRLVLHWSAHDADGGQLQAHVEEAPDGRSYRSVYLGPSHGHVAVAGRYLAGGAHARVRVTVDDGFNQVSVVSRPFAAAGTPPLPRIDVPAEGAALQAGRQMLTGAAVDDSGRPLTGRSLTWYAGSRRLGTGSRLTTTLSAGRVVLRLRARDRSGSVATVRRVLRLTPPALRVTSLRVPLRVATHVRRVTVQLATSATARLHVGGHDVAVGPRTRSVSVPLPGRPDIGVLRVTLKITASGGATTRALLAVYRG